MPSIPLERELSAVFAFDAEAGAVRGAVVEVGEVMLGDMPVDAVHTAKVKT